MTVTDWPSASMARLGQRWFRWCSRLSAEETRALPATLAEPLSTSCKTPESVHEALLTHGYIVLNGALSESSLVQARAIVSRLLQLEASTGGPCGSTENFQLSTRLPLKHHWFRILSVHPQVLSLVRALLGDDCRLSSMNALRLRPHGVSAQKEHLDQAEPCPGKLLGVNCIYLLDRFTVENGGTRIFDVENRCAVIEAPAGSVVLMNTGVLHGHGWNRTPHPRTAIHVSYFKRWLAVEYPMGLAVKPALSRWLPGERDLYAEPALWR